MLLGIVLGIVSVDCARDCGANPDARVRACQSAAAPLIPTPTASVASSHRRADQVPRARRGPGQPPRSSRSAPGELLSQLYHPPPYSPPPPGRISAAAAALVSPLPIESVDLAVTLSTTTIYVRYLLSAVTVSLPPYVELRWMRRSIAYADNGYRVGESHHQARIPDSVVRLIRDLREYDGLSYSQIAKRVGCSRQHVHRICTYVMRAAIPAEWRTVGQGVSDV